MTLTRIENSKGGVDQPQWWQREGRPAPKRSEASKDLHKTFNLAVRCGFAGFEIALNAQSGEEGQHHLRNRIGIHPGIHRLYIHGEKALQRRPVLCHDRMSFVRKNGKL